MKHLRMLLICLGVAMAATAFGQPALVDIFYDNSFPNADPLGAPCNNPVPYPNNAAQVCFVHDVNCNGFDEADTLACPDGSGPGQPSQCCLPVNGSATDESPGYFWFESSVIIAQPFESPDTSCYYLEISHGGVCWRSSRFTINPGINEFMFDNTNWTCTTGPCRQVTPPAAPTNFAVDSTGCLRASVSWQHTGENVSGFSVMRVTGTDSVQVANVPSTSRNATFRVLSDQPRSYHVRAVNSGGYSTSNTATGRTYLIEFAEDESGTKIGGTRDSIRLQRPNNQCPSASWLWLLVGNQRHGNQPLASTSLDTLMLRWTWPAATLSDCRLLLVDSSYDHGVIFTDTTDSRFSIVPNSAGSGEMGVPQNFALHPNYPNPFNPVTTINFDVPAQADVRIEVYNIMGQLVKTLHQGQISVGFHTLNWDGTSDTGVSVGTGLYLCRMTAPNFVQTQKMLLMK